MSAEDMNRYLCDIDPDSIDKLVSQMQKQINTTALYDLVRCFKSVSECFDIIIKNMLRLHNSLDCASLLNLVIFYEDSI